MQNDPALSQVLVATVEPGKILVGVLLVVFGLANLAFAPRLLAFRAWWMERTIGAKFIPSGRTYAIYRGLGVAVLAVGVVLLTGLL